MAYQLEFKKRVARNIEILWGIWASNKIHADPAVIICDYVEAMEMWTDAEDRVEALYFRTMEMEWSCSYIIQSIRINEIARENIIFEISQGCDVYDQSIETIRDIMLQYKSWKVNGGYDRNIWKIMVQLNKLELQVDCDFATIAYYEQSDPIPLPMPDIYDQYELEGPDN